MDEVLTRQEIVFELARRGLATNVDSIRKLQARGTVDLAAYVVNTERTNGNFYYRPDVVDVLERYLRKREAQRKRNRARSAAKYKLTTKNPPEVVEARLQEFRSKWPDDNVRLQLILGFLESMNLNVKQRMRLRRVVA